MTGARILVVDDERQIHRFLAPALEACGYTVQQALTAREALRLLLAWAPDLVLLDLGLPDEDGQDVLKRLRLLSTVPIITLSARGQEAQKIMALDNGADGYVEKPFSLGELLARVRVGLRHRRTQEGLGTVLSTDSLTIDLETRVVHDEGKLISLSKREIALLETLMRNLGKVVTHQQPDRGRHPFPGADPRESRISGLLRVKAPHCRHLQRLLWGLPN
jgi:two-component system KDP operon response regulator KdpE